jgi:small subunit ribosomal protein S3
MGRKVNPIGFRLGYVHGWQSNWYGGRNYTELLHEDLRIRQFVMKELQRAGISKVEIERQANKVDVTVHTSKPGIVIGKQGANVDRIRKMLEAQLPGRKVHLKIEEIKTPELDARLVAESIGEQITRRVSYRRAMKHAVTQAMRRGAKGVKLKVSGRLGGAEMSRSVTEMNGRVPLQTLRANIDYGVVHAHTTYGRIGVKVWIYKGDMAPEAKQAPPQTRRSQAAAAAPAGDK